RHESPGTPPRARSQARPQGELDLPRHVGMVRAAEVPRIERAHVIEVVDVVEQVESVEAQLQALRAFALLSQDEPLRHAQVDVGERRTPAAVAPELSETTQPKVKCPGR